METPSGTGSKPLDVVSQKTEAAPSLPTAANRPNYSQLRETQTQKPEAVPQEPTRPVTVRSPDWAQSQHMPSQQRSANEYAKVLAARLSTPKVEKAEQVQAENQQQKQKPEQER